MKTISIQMVDLKISSDWWKEIIKYFVKENDKLQIRCWNEETVEVDEALKYGASHIEKNETCIDGVVNKAFLDELINSPEPVDKTIYNKMTKYFTIRITNGEKLLESSHYGTELYLVVSEEDVHHFEEIMKPYRESFSIAIV